MLAKLVPLTDLSVDTRPFFSVAEAAGDILRHLTTRANSTPAPTLSFLAPVQQQQSQQAPSLLQCQDDVTRVQALLHLQTDRYVAFPRNSGN